MEQERGLALISGGLEVHLISPGQYMQMDRSTVEALELVKAISPVPSCGKWKKKKNCSLLGCVGRGAAGCPLACPVTPLPPPLHLQAA